MYKLVMSFVRNTNNWTAEDTVNAKNTMSEEFLVMLIDNN